MCVNLKWILKSLNLKLILFPSFIGQYETRKEGEVVLAGANASEEDADEGTDESAVSGIGKMEAQKM